MYYSIYVGDTVIYNSRSPSKNAKIKDPKLDISDSSAGTLTFVVPKTNNAYAKIIRLASEIEVRKNDRYYWAGRVIDEKVDFWNNRHFTCEGELAYLNDTTQPMAEYHDMTVRSFLETLIGYHNQKANANKKFTVGIVTVTDPNDSLYRYTNLESTLSCINEKLVDRLGGHLRIRHADGKRYIDYLKDAPRITNQKVEFGKNLLDFTKHWDLTDLVTVVRPQGARLDESPIPALDAYLDITSVNGGSPYVVSPSAVETYGWIEAVVKWDDVTEPANLKTKAESYLAEAQFEEMTLEVKAVDLAMLKHQDDITINDDIELLDEIRVISVQHGLDRYFPVAKMSIPLADPSQAQYTFGSVVQQSLTSKTRSGVSDILQRLDEQPTSYQILDQAKTNATQLINTATTGYITLVHNEYGAQELYISDAPDYSQSKRFWRWNLNGLGYSGNWGQSYEVAMTMDGSIVANFITTGTMSAYRVRGGIFEIGGTGLGRDGQILVKNASGQTLITIDINGITFVGPEADKMNGWATKITKDTVTTAYVNALKVKAGSVDAENITGTTITGKILRSNNNNFYATADGNLTLRGQFDVYSNIRLGGGYSTIYDNGAVFRAGDTYCYIDPGHNYGSIGYGYTISNGAGWGVHIEPGRINMYRADHGRGLWIDTWDLHCEDGTVNSGYINNTAHINTWSMEAGGTLGGGYLFSKGNCSIQGNLYVGGSFPCNASKSRVVKTPDYDERLLYCLETPSPTFSDIGEGVTDDTGKCFVFIEEIYSETIALNVQYQVTLQKYGPGDIWVSERNPSYFVVEGTPDLKFGWVMHAIQRDYDTLRMAVFNKDDIDNLIVDPVDLDEATEYILELVKTEVSE